MSAAPPARSPSGGGRLEPRPAGRPSGLAIAVLAAGAGLTLTKLVFAHGTPLFPDEAFYWQCARRLGLAFSDHPAQTALWIRAGTELLGTSPLGVRLVFLLAGAALPALVFAAARPAVGARDAWLAAGAALLLPGLALMGALAIPDVPLLFATALGVLAVPRALETGRLGPWALAGLAGALGLAAEYRIFPFGLAVAALLLGTAEGRRALRGPGPWLALAIAGAGLAPTLAFNLAHDFAPIRYQLVERHGGEAPGVAKHLGQQLLLVTPLLYVALLGTLAVLLARARRGDARALRFAILALVPLLFWLAASTFNDDRHTDAHWPLPAYLPLLPFLPGALRGFAARGRWALGLALAAPAVAAAATTAALVAVLLPATAPSILDPFLGWDGLAEELERRLAREADAPAVLLFDNYVAASEAEFELARRAPALLARTPWYVVDHRLNRNHGRSLQYRLWGRGEAAFREHAGRPALVVIEPDRSKRYEHEPLRAHLGELVAGLRPAGRLETGPPGAVRRFRLLRGRVADARPGSPAPVVGSDP